MAIAKSMLGKLTGKIGNLVCYESQEGETIVRAASLTRKPSSMEQQRQETEFGTLSEVATMLRGVMGKGFPKGKGLPAGRKGFLRANIGGEAVVTEVADPERQFLRKKGTPRYFRGRVDFAKLQVAAGAVAVPAVGMEEVAEGVEAAREGLEGKTAGNGKEAGEAVRRVRFRNEECTRIGYDCWPEDRVYAMALCPKGDVSQLQEIGARGETSEAEAVFKKKWKGEVHFYAFATSADGKRASRSVYLGMMDW